MSNIFDPIDRIHDLHWERRKKILEQRIEEEKRKARPMSDEYFQEGDHLKNGMRIKKGEHNWPTLPSSVRWR